MKLVRRFSTVWGYALTLVAAALMTAAEAEVIKNKAVVRRAGPGKAEVSTNNGQSWKPARVGDRLGENSIVRTAPGSTVDLFLGDNGPVVRVTEDTRLAIDKLDLEDAGIEKVIETQLDLKNGRILGNVKKMAAASKYEVETPVGVAGIRGTEYSISANGDVHVVTGTVIVVYVINGQTFPPVVVGAGQSVRAPVAGAQPVVIALTPALLADITGQMPPPDGGGDDGGTPPPPGTQAPSDDRPITNPDAPNLTETDPHNDNR